MLKVVTDTLNGTLTGLGAVRQMVTDAHLSPRERFNPQCFRTCDKAVALLRRTQPSILDNYLPVFALGHGNCLFRSVSLFCYGSGALHCNLRALSAAEM